MLKKLCLCSLILLFAACSVEDEATNTLNSLLGDDLSPPTWTHGTWKSNDDSTTAIIDSSLVSITIISNGLTMDVTHQKSEKDTTTTSTSSEYIFTSWTDKSIYKFVKDGNDELKFTKDSETEVVLVKQSS